MATDKGHIDIYRLKGSKCPLCGRFIALDDLYTEYYARTPIAGPFRNAISWKEYKISGVCQKCQDKIWGVEE